MSYCRFSADNWKSDVYCYEGRSSFVTHVAGNRIVGDIPKIPALGAVENDQWLVAHSAQMKFLADAKREPIALEHAGKTIEDVDARGMRDTLLMLQGIGFYVPAYVIVALNDEIADTNSAAETKDAL